MKRIPLGRLCYEFNRNEKPISRISAGERLVVESQDAFSGQIRTDSDRRDKTKMPYSNPTTGPIYVEGAERGDTLAVTIHSITPTMAKCFTRTSDPRQLTEWLGADCPHGTHVCEISDGVIHWSDKVKIPYTPMLGCIGTAPDWGVPTTNPPGPHGGNMDIVETGPGATLSLPVFVPGALLYLGDAHAAMGHGELSASGLEMPAETEITVDLIRGKTIPSPRIETADELVTVSSATPTERAIAQAYSWLILWMESDYGWDRWKAFDLLTHAGQISIGYYASGAVATKIAKRYVR
jgi:acetamidase/formamidase